ncbi:MAG TPA: SUMF1/EgtB/PvdO family nonheme iron enzyme [Pirellulales bacterium]|nr:SUMF1/EgtB/PvdO family nonheme iron enzyme [Pirellulales bacterium]
MKILDMGLAKFTTSMDQEALTATGNVIGTTDYMAPEQAMKKQEIDGRADIYSLGCTLYRLLTGTNVYESKSIVQTLLAHRDSPIPKLADKRTDIPAALDAVFAKMVAKRPEDRYQSMNDVIAALEQAVVLTGVAASDRGPTRASNGGAAVRDSAGDSAPAIRTSDPSTTSTSETTRIAVEKTGRAATKPPSGKSTPGRTSTAATNGDVDEPSRLRQLMPFVTLGVAVVFLLASGLYALLRGRSSSTSVAKSQAGVAATAPAGSATAGSAEGAAVAWVLEQGGYASIKLPGADAETRIASRATVPAGAFTVVAVSITGSGKIADGRLDHLASLKGLENLDVGNTAVSNAGLADIASLTELKSLSLENTGISDAGLIGLAPFKKLERLSLAADKKITDAAAEYLIAIKSLRSLSVTGTSLTAQGVAAIMAGLPQCNVVHSIARAELDALAAKVSAPPTAASSPTATTSAPATAPAAKPFIPTPKRGETVDLLPLIDVKRDLIYREWSREGAALVSSGEDHARISIPVQPPSDYVLKVTASRLSGDNALNVGLVVGGVPVMATIGADHNLINGLSTVDGVTADRNPSGRNVPALASDRETTITFAVGKNNVRVTRDDEVLVAWSGDVKHLKMLTGWGGANPRWLWIGSESSSMKITGLELTAASDPITLPPKPASPEFALGQAVDLLERIDPARDAVTGQWQFDGVGLLSPDTTEARLQIPVTPPKEYALVVEMEQIASSDFVIGLVVDGYQTGVTALLKGFAGLHQVDGKGADVNMTKKRSTALRDRTRHTLIATVRHGAIQLSVDGVALLEWAGVAKRLNVAPELRVPNRDQLYLATYGRCRFTRYDLVPLGENESVRALARSKTKSRDARPAIPTDDALQSATRALRDQFKGEFAKARQPGDKLALAQQLYLDSFRSQSNPAMRYALLDEARDLAIDIGDAYLAGRILDAITTAFQADEPSVELELWAKLLPKARGAIPNRDAADSALLLAEHLAAIDRHDEARRAVDHARQAAGKAQEPNLVKSLSDRGKHFASLKTAFDTATKAEEKLASDPTDPEANNIVGRYRCFEQQDFLAGLPLLARGNDPVLAELAKQTLSTGSSTEQMIEAANAWWDQAEANSKQKLDLMLGARYWYRRAMPGLSGIDLNKPKERLAEIGKLRAADKGLPTSVTLEVAPGIAMRFRLIPAGEFLMGASEVKGLTSHTVRITKPFYIAMTEVTQAQFNAVMGESSTRSSEGSQYPYYMNNTNVEWQDADLFCKRLNAYPSFASYQVRLPTEAEWEYAARAGTSTKFWFGDDPSQLGITAWFGRQDPMPVGLLRPNVAGLFDVHGNVSEWCSDFEDKTYYDKSPAEDPTGPETGREHIFRGGQFSSSADQCRVFERRPGFTNRAAIGLRVVLSF